MQGRGRVGGDQGLYWWLCSDQSCDTLRPACRGAGADVGINTGATGPAVSTVESRQSVTGVSVIQDP